MSEQTAAQNYPNGKPVNINISFNISRKQVTQNINPIQAEKSFNLKNTNAPQENPVSSIKSRTNSYRPPKTPQLAQTDRHVYSKDLQFVRPTEELKRKKKRKRSSGDHPIDKTIGVPFYALDLDKSLPSHKRGYTTTISKKTPSGSKNKKQTSRIDQLYKQSNTVPISAVVNESKKVDGKTVKMQKNLKTILNKLINNELSKRSLPLPSVPSKSKYNQSTSLTARKGSTGRQQKKGSTSKSHMIMTHRQKPSQYQQQQSSQDAYFNSEIEVFQNPKIIEKLSNFKSNENSLLISEADHMEDDSDQYNLERRSPRSKKIVIKTDQSIECIDEIHDWQKTFYKDTFFNDSTTNNHPANNNTKTNGFFRKPTSAQTNSQQKNNSDTLLLIETYVKLLNAPDQQNEERKSHDPFDHDGVSKKSSNVNEITDIYDEDNFLDFGKFDKRMGMDWQKGSKSGQQKGQEKFGVEKGFRQRQRYQEPQVERRSKIQEDSELRQKKTHQEISSKRYDRIRPEAHVYKQSPMSDNSQNQQEPQEQSESYEQNISEIDHQHEQQHQQSHLQQQSPQQHQFYQQSVPFRPFISSQMGRQASSSIQGSEQRAKLNELKKHEIQKWGTLLQYIKSNMNNGEDGNNEANTQEVLEQVYEYLSKAKVDLIREGRNIVSALGGQGRNEDGIRRKGGRNQRLEEEFTNKLSSQLEKSDASFVKAQQQHIHASNQRTNEKHQQSFTPQQNSANPSSQSGFQVREEQEKILNQEARSFKEDYESSEHEQEEESLKFMNLSTIETALRNRFNQLTRKKEKQFEKLQLLYEDKKLSQSQYDQQKQSIENDFKNQTNEILTVKKNIWKGYNEAKGILDKSYMNSKIEEQFRKGQVYGRRVGGSANKKDKKDKRMMKCLSESYLNKKKIDYKKFIEDQERKNEQQYEQELQEGDEDYEESKSSHNGRKNNYGLKRQHGQMNSESQYSQSQGHDEEYDDEKQSDEQEEKKNHEEIEDQDLSAKRSRGKMLDRSDKNGRIERSSEQQSEGGSIRRQDQNNNDESPSQSHQNLSNSSNQSVDSQFQKISKKLHKLKQQHEQSLAQQNHTTNDQQKLLQYSSQSHQQKSSPGSSQSQQTDPRTINEFNTHMQIDAKQLYMNEIHSPVIVTISPESSVHYEQVERSIHSDGSQQEEDEEDDSNIDQDYVDERDEMIGEVKHSSSSDEDKDDDYAQEEDREEEGEEEEEHEEADAHHDDDYSDQEQKMIAQQLIEAQKPNSPQNSTLASAKNTPPLKTTLQQLKQPQQPNEKPKSKNQPNGLIDQKSAAPSSASPSSKEPLSPSTVSLIKKMKYLTEQDREDIFEFMFLDLCIELYQEPCFENKIMNTINKHVQKQYELAKRKKGVKTNLNVVKDYLKRFCGYLIRTNKNVLENINVPMGPTAIEMLKYMHENDDFDEDEPIDGDDGIVTLIIPVAVFDTFERSLLPTLEFEKYYDNQEKQHERVSFLKNIFHIHNKALFDALNEFLDQQRPFGIWGKPFPWKKSSSFPHKFSEIQQEQKLKKSAQKVVQACSYVCGLLVDKEQSLVGNAKISEGYIEQIREDRISRMLANEMIENEERWVFYDDEQTEVLVETGNYVYNSIVRELMEEMFMLGKRVV